MNKKTAKKTATKKTTKTNRNIYSTTSVQENIGVLPSGMYRVRKSVNGVRYSKNFSTLKACRQWLKSL